MVLITGSACSASVSGGSSPWNWSARSPDASAPALTWPVGWSQKTPTGVTKGGSRRTIAATCSGVTKRGVPSTKMKPRASAPASTAVSASPRFVIPQIFTRVMRALSMHGWGETPPPCPPGRFMHGWGETPPPMSPRTFHAWVGRDAPPMSPRTLHAWVGRGAPPMSPPRACSHARSSRMSPASRAFRVTRPTQRQFPDLGGDVRRPHQALADQHGVDAGGDDAPHVGGGEEPALAHHDRPRRDQRRQLERGLEARLEGGEVAVVDADHRAARGERRVELGGRVALDERREAESLGRREQVAQQRRRQDRDDQQHRVGARGARLPELVLLER